MAKLRNLSGRNFPECAPALLYMVSSSQGQVVHTRAILFDVAADWASLYDTQAHNEKLREKALQERLKGADKPEL